MTNEEILSRLFELRDEKYRDFQSKLIPDVKPDRMIGVRTPLLKGFAKELFATNGAQGFISTLPHGYFDENQLHAFIVSLTKDYAVCIERVNEFLPFVDNWATCDQLSPKAFKKHKKELLNEIDGWLSSKKTYTVRFAIGMLMQHFLDEDFSITLAEKVAAVNSDEYYIKMMVAWYFATALAKRYDEVIPFIESKRLDRWTHNKAIQKSLESFRISPDKKEYLRSLKIK